MAIITYVPAANYDTTEQGHINIGGGTDFDVHAALASGGGVITVDSAVSPILVGALDNFPGLIRQGVTPGPTSTTDIIGPVIAHNKNNAVGDVLIRGNDGIFAPAQGAFAPSGVPANAGARLGNFSPDLCMYNFKPSNTSHLKTALAHGLLNDALAGITFVGDSKVAGFNGTIILGAKGWPGKLLSALGAIGYTIAGTGVVFPTQNQTAPASKDSRWTLTNFSGGGTNNSFVSSAVSGATAVFVGDRPGTNVDVYSFGTSAPFTVSIDGAAAVTVTPTGGGVLYKYSVTGLTNATHTVTITSTTASTTYVLGANVFNSTGLQFHNHGISSSKASPDWANTAQYYQALQTSKQLPSQAVFVSLGVNDCQNNISVASYKTAMSGTIIPTYTALSKDVVLVVETPPSTAHQGTAVNWDAFVSAQYDLADSLNLPLIDLTYLYSDSNANAQALGWMFTDGLHELELGYQVSSRAMATALTRI